MPSTIPDVSWPQCPGCGLRDVPESLFWLVDDDQRKAGSLETLVKRSNSVYATDAYFELGETYMKMGKENQAESIFTAFIQDYPKSRFIKNAHRIGSDISYTRERQQSIGPVQKRC